MPSIEELVRRTLQVRARVDAERSVLLAITGVDASGKGFVAARVADTLRARGACAATINVDCWLNLPHVRSRTAAQASTSTITPFGSTRYSRTSSFPSAPGSAGSGAASRAPPT